MNDASRARVAADEAAIEKQYNEVLANTARDVHRRVSQQIANTWTSTTKLELPRSGELVGRVALDEPSDMLDGARDFYIGTAYCDVDGYQVFSWAAEIACTFYRKSDKHHLLCDDVVGVRVFAHRAGRIVDYEDEALEDAGASLFPSRKLEVPRAPVARPAAPALRDAAGAEESDRSTAEASNAHESANSTAILSTSPRSTAPTPAPSPRGSVLRVVPGPALRTPDLLRRQLAAPKTVSMSAVLATLQSDQYEAITRPASDSQVLQGHPGTGKTIIAAHRAAYLLNSDAPRAATPKGHVLILGPTVEYVEHVRGALRTLIDDDRMYEVKAIPSLLEDLAELPRSAVPTETFVWEDVSLELAGLVDLAFSRAREQLDDVGEKPTSSDVYAELLWILQDPPPQGLEADWAHYLRELPSSYADLKRRRISSYRGLMAYIGARTMRMRNPGHVIVDEAQDIHPIEWQVLGRLGNSGGWTILGDLNQRRTDHTFGSWDEVAQLLAIEGDDGKAPLQILERGYRSTSQIIRFANQLLPARDRGLYSLQQDGEAPSVSRALSAKEVPEVALKAVESLLARVGTGTVAVITVDPTSIRAAMTRRGWKADIGDALTWRNGDQVLKMLPPERARGLEFDGVVVVEPAAFPENVGRQGVLYTALTRANRLLAVVHHLPLPRGMKAQP